MQRALCPQLIGREQELGALEDVLLAASRGDGSVALLTGEAGMGKTRLAGEVVARARRLGFTVLLGACSEADLTIPYLPFVEAIGNHLPTADIGRLREQLGPSAAELAQLFPRLDHGAGSPGAGDPQNARLRLFEAIADLLRVIAEGTGLLLVLEDLHWADPSSRELLDFLARRLRYGRVMLLGTYRSDEMHRRHPLLPLVQGWRRAQLVESVDLRALTAGEVGAMMCAIFDLDQVSDEFRDLVHERSEGNPFVVEEMLKLALERGDIYRTAAGWERRELGQLLLPDTVKDTILMRLERLPADQVEILSTAAVLGRSFDPAVLAAAVPHGAREVEEALHAAEQQQILDEEGGGRYRFRHALTREVVYDDLPAPRRERLHLTAAEVLRRRGGGSPPELVAHLMAGGAVEEAVPLCIAAGREALSQAAFEEAIELFRRALPHVTEVRARADLLCDLGLACSRSGDPKSGVEYLEQGVTALEEMGDAPAAARQRVELGRSYQWHGDRQQSQAQYYRVVEVLEPLGPSEHLAAAYMRLAAERIFVDDTAGARDLCQRAIATAQAASAEEIEIWTYNFLGLAQVSEGKLEEGRRSLWRSYEEALRRNLHFVAGNALHNLSAVLSWDTPANARESLELVPLMRRLHAGSWSRSSPLLAEAFNLYFLGDLEGSLKAGKRAHELGEVGNQWVSRYAEIALVATLVEMGRSDEASGWVGITHVDRQRDEQEAAATIRFHLAGDALEPAVDAARTLLDLGRAGMHLTGFALDAAVEAFCAAALHDEGREVLEGSPAWRRGWPFTLRARARLDRDAASALQALEQFRAAGYPLEVARTLVLFAELEPGSASASLREAAEIGARTGSTLIRAEAARRLAEMGEEPEPAPAREREPLATGERLVTVLFADVRGYTELTSTLPPADLADRVSTLQRWGGAEVEKNHGTVDKFAGDAMMATFNISGATVEHTAHALQVALALRDKAALLGLPVGAGIATGAAVVGRLAPDANVSVLGETTNLASRLQGAAGAGEILLSTEAHRRVEGWLAERGLAAEPAALRLKGIAGDVQAYRMPAPVALATA